MTLSALFANPPESSLEILFVVLGALGAILLLYGIFLEKEERQDAVFLVGALSLLVYSISSRNLIFSAAFFVFALGNAVELYRIVTGKHQHLCYPCEKGETRK